MKLDHTTYTGSKSDLRAVAEFICNAVNGWTEDPTRMQEYFIPDGGWEFPFAPDEFGLFYKEVKGFDAMERYFTSLIPFMRDLDVGPADAWHVQALVDSESYLCRYSGTATLKPSDRLYRQDYISVVTLESGKIRAYREYWDPYVALRDFGLVRPGGAAR